MEEMRIAALILFLCGLVFGSALGMWLCREEDGGDRLSGARKLAEKSQPFLSAQPTSTLPHGYQPQREALKGREQSPPKKR